MPVSGINFPPSEVLQATSIIGEASYKQSPTPNEVTTGRSLKRAATAGQRRLRTETVPAPKFTENVCSKAVKSEDTSLKFLGSIDERIKNYASNSWGWPALHYAIEMRDEEAAFYLLKTKPEQTKMLTPDLPLMDFHFGNNADQDYDFTVGVEAGMSTIELAVRHNCSVALVARLIDLGADFKQSRTEYPGLIRDNWESKTGYVKGRNKLIAPGSHYSFTPLYWAIVNKNKDSMNLLIEKGCDINSYAYERRTLVQTELNKQNGYVVGCKHIYKNEKYTAKALIEGTATPNYEEVIIQLP